MDETSQEKSESGVGSSIQRDDELSQILQDKFNKSISDTPTKPRRMVRGTDKRMDRSALVYESKQLDAS